MLKIYKDLTEIERKQRYLDAMEGIAKSVKEAIDKKPSDKLYEMAAQLKEIMLYNSKLDMELDDTKFSLSQRDKTVAVLRTRITHLETELKHNGQLRKTRNVITRGDD